eukprot:m.129849 g.129849  ORF g.129849 m.129849 type:complete len:81 (+) comp9774_c0_seq9:1521-1763(+)
MKLQMKRASSPSDSTHQAQTNRETGLPELSIEQFWTTDEIVDCRRLISRGMVFAFSDLPPRSYLRECQHTCSHGSEEQAQ